MEFARFSDHISYQIAENHCEEMMKKKNEINLVCDDNHNLSRYHRAQKTSMYLNHIHKIKCDEFFQRHNGVDCIGICILITTIAKANQKKFRGRIFAKKYNSKHKKYNRSMNKMV